MTDVLLIADADITLCRFYQEFFTGHGFRVETAATALECLSRLKRLAPAVLVIDLNLNWGGAEGLLTCLQEEIGHRSVPPVFLTGTDPQEILRVPLAPPVIKYFEKPFLAAELLEPIAAYKTARWRKIQTRDSRQAPDSLILVPNASY
jgi:CheY-like chemotaxis protein